MTDRDKLVAVFTLLQKHGKITSFEERGNSIEIFDGPKYMFTAEGEIKSIIRDGRAFGPDGERPYVAPRGKK